jgi:hypothetical protein
LLLLSLAVASAGALATTQNWSVRSVNGSCELESAAVPINDGYLDISVTLQFSGEGLRGVTPSNIDMGVGEPRLLVDGKALDTRISVNKQTDVLIDGDMTMLGEHFMRGGEAQLLLSFWPSWPVTGVKEINYSLKGFTAAWKQYQQCL